MGWPISAGDVQAELGWQDDRDVDLGLYARAAVERIEQEIGPRSGQAIVAAERGPVAAIVLPYPAASLTSITVGGAAADVGRFTLDTSAGIVSGPFGFGDVVVTAAAPATVDAPVELAARYLAATWVRQSKVGPVSARSRGSEPDGDVLQGFAMPRRVSEMIRPYVPGWGFA
jgi:hypothetical protein